MAGLMVVSPFVVRFIMGAVVFIAALHVLTAPGLREAPGGPVALGIQWFALVCYGLMSLMIDRVKD